MDVRPGGVWRRFVMSGPYGDFPNKIVYIEIVRPERLVYTHGSDTDVGGMKEGAAAPHGRNATNFEIWQRRQKRELRWARTGRACRIS